MRTEIHHIQEWAVYQTHDERAMVAICPTCHDAVHHGELRITDETVYRWKNIDRDGMKRGYLYIEPRQNPSVLLGTNELVGPNDGFFAFQLSPRNTCSIRVLDEEILLLGLNVTNLNGEEIINFQQNNWKQLKQESVTLRQTPGHIFLTTSAAPDFLPEWVTQGIHEGTKGMRDPMPPYPPEGELVLLDIEVMEPGKVRMEGLWVDAHTAIVATPHGLCIVAHGANGESTAATMTNVAVDLTQNGVLSPTILRIFFPDRDLKKFVVRLGYSPDEDVPRVQRDTSF